MVDLTRAIQGGMTLAGAFGNGDAVYQQQMSQSAQMEAILAQARMRRDQERARADLGDTLRALGHDPMLAGVLNAGHDPGQISRYGKDMQIQDFRQGALNEALNGNLPRSNAYLAAIDGKPLPLTKIEGNSIVNPYALDGYQGPTAIGESQIARNQSSASAADALAGQRHAQTRIAKTEHAAKMGGRWNPGSRAPGNFTEPSTEVLLRALGGLDAFGKPQLDPVKEADFAAWRRDHPEITNGNEALNLYRNQFYIRPQGGSRMYLIDGSQPFIESQVTQGQQIPGQIRPDIVPAPQPAQAAAGAGYDHQNRMDVLAEANRAIARGADPEAVKRRLIERGILPPDYFNEPIR